MPRPRAAVIAQAIFRWLIGGRLIDAQKAKGAVHFT